MSTSPDGLTYEYAIELPGQGWLLSMMPGTYCVVTEPTVIGGQIDDAWTALGRAQKFYHQIGADVVGSQLRLVARSIAVVRSDWEAITVNTTTDPTADVYGQEL